MGEVEEQQQQLRLHVLKQKVFAVVGAVASEWCRRHRCCLFDQGVLPYKVGQIGMFVVCTCFVHWANFLSKTIG